MRLKPSAWFRGPDFGSPRPATFARPSKTLVASPRISSFFPSKPPAAFLAQLSAAQIAAYLQDSNESSAWWSEYLGNLTTLLDHATPAVGGSSTATTAPASDTTTPATKAAHAVTGAE